MRVLFTCWLRSGHFLPLVPVARALARAGHEVAFATPAYFAPAVEAAGFRHLRAGLEQPLTDLFPELRTLTGLDYAKFVSREGFAGAGPAHLIPDLLTLAATWPFDLLVRDEVAYGGCIAAERLGVAHAAVNVHAVGVAGRVERIGTRLNQHRADQGLPPDPTLVMLDRYLTLHPFPPSFRDPAIPVVATTHHIRPTPDDRSGPEGLPDWMGSLPDRPVVYLGLGTIFNQPEVFRTVIAGLREEVLTLVVTVGRDREPSDYGPQPENVHIERYIPLSLLLPYCHLAVIAGGSGTLMAALGQGLPVVVVPISADQPANAARCLALGLGETIAPDDLTPERAHEAVLAVLAEPTYRANAARIRAEMAALPGPEYAVALLERLAVEKRPIPTT